MAAKRGILTWTFLNVSNTSFVGLAKRLGKGEGMWEAIGSLKITIVVLLILGGSVSSCKGSLDLWDASLKCFSLLIDMALAFSLGFLTVWEGSLPGP